MNNLTVIESDGLIKIYRTDKGENVVDARQLHQALESNTKFNDWVLRRVNECDAIENEDYIVLLKNEKNLTGGRPSKEYILKLDIAKEMAMLERNEKGKAYRRYFIEVDKKYKQLPRSIEDMIILQAQSVKELKVDVTENAKKIDKLIDKTYVTPEQKNALQVARSKRVIDLIGYKTKAYNDSSFRNRVYAELGRQYKNYFRISSYGYTLKTKFDEAIEVIENYKLSMGLGMELKKLQSA